MVVGGCRSLVAEHWRLKPEALGLIPGGTTFLSFSLPFHRSSDTNSPNNLHRSLDLGEPHLSGSLCCDEAHQILSSHKYIHICSLIPLNVVNGREFEMPALPLYA